jgi:hypothetical protein
MATATWTDALVDEVIRLWLDKKSARDISNIFLARGLNVTRNSVIGKVNRLGLQRAKVTKLPPMPRTPTPMRQAQPRKPKPALQRPAVKFVPQVVEINSLRLPLLDLELGQCRFECTDADSAADYLFCGLPVVECSSYCPAHKAITWVAPRPRQNARPFPRAA